MADAKSIINLGLGKIAASRVSSISPPKTPVERHCADGYPTWRDNELEKRDWYFAMVVAKQLVLTDTLTYTEDGRKYVYAIPNDFIRPLRDKLTEWQLRGRFIYSARATLYIDYIRSAPEGDFVPSFRNVLACRVAQECVEFATQSNTKDETADMKYARALNDAARVNAYVAGPQDISLADENSSWIQARLGNDGG